MTTFTNILTLLTISFVLLGCSRRQVKKDEVYFIVKHPTTINCDTIDDKTPPTPPPPPTTFYGNFNFILIDSSTIYYHKRHIYRFCGTGVDNTRPPNIVLFPELLTKLSIDDLPEFLDTSISESLVTGKYFFASISTPTDTIKNRAFKIITDFFELKKIKQYTIRNWTEEEKFVTTAKIENKKYYPDSVEWKIGFDTTDSLPLFKTNEK
jgi:hypothetical protein